MDFGAQSYRPFGTAAELAVVPAQQAIELPDGVPDGWPAWEFQESQHTGLSSRMAQSKA